MRTEKKIHGRLREGERHIVGKGESPPFGNSAGASFMSSKLGSEGWVSELRLVCMCAAKCWLISPRISRPLISPNYPYNPGASIPSLGGRAREEGGSLLLAMASHEHISMKLRPHSNNLPLDLLSKKHRELLTCNNSGN